MGVFDDKKFDELDWISQATEPIDSELNSILGQLPDEFVIDFATFKLLQDRSYTNRVEIGQILQYLTVTLNIMPDELGWTRWANVIVSCFKLNLSSRDIIINFEEETIEGGVVSLIKTTSILDDRALQSILGDEGCERVRALSIYRDRFPRANEIMELLGKCDDGIKTRSDYKKRRAIMVRLREIMKNNEWNIKDTSLANKVGTWIVEYIEDGNLASYSNFCRLKVMTHKNQAIYSIEEVK